MKRNIIENSQVWSLRILAYFVIAVTLWVLLDIIVKGSGVIGIEFLTSFPSRSGVKGGIFPAIVGTVSLVGVAILAALPLGVLSAIFLSEYARAGRITTLIRMAIITLAGVPSIVFGLFGLGLFVIFLNFGASVLAGGLTLACMILPTIIVASEEALQAVPKGFREASLALGASKWETIMRSVLPYAMSGILTGSILGIGRAAGETAPILLTAAAFYLSRLPHSFFDQVMALPYHLYILATQNPDFDAAKPMQYGTALVLLVLVSGVSVCTMVLRAHIRRKYRW